MNGRQKRHLRSLAHHLEPIVLVGAGGVSEGVIAATDRALADHELVKVRLPQVDRDERARMAAAIEAGTHAALAGLSGRIAILYRRHPTEPRITLPR